MARLTALALWSLLLSFSLASTTISEPTLSPLLPRQEPHIRCQTARAPDYYGLGVRLGIYFAWLQAYIANVFLPSEIAGALDTNVIFLFTLLVAMIKCSSVNMLEQIDGLILMHLSGGTIFGILSIWGYRTCQYTLEGPKAIKYFGGFGTHFRLFITLAISVFGLWFWMFGVTGALDPMGPHDDVDPPNSPECGTTLYTFMFAKVRATGGIRIFYIVVCTCCIVYFGIMLLASSLAGYSRAHKMIELAKSKQWANSSRLRFATGFNYRELSWIFAVLRWANLVWLIFSAMLVEFSLNFNHVTAVLGGPNDNELHLPAQLLPLLIGAFGFLRICWLTFEEWRSPGDRDPSVTRSTDSPCKSRTMHVGLGLLAFSPALARDSPTKSEEHDENELDDLERNRSRPVRYLVSWLPWLSLLKHVDDDGRGKTPLISSDGQANVLSEKHKRYDLEDGKAHRSSDSGSTWKGDHEDN